MWHYLRSKETHKTTKIVEVLKELKRGKVNVNKNKKYNTMTIIILSLKDNVLHHVSNIKKNQMYHGRPSSIYLKQTMKQKHYILTTN